MTGSAGTERAIGRRLASVDVGSNTVRALAAVLLPGGRLEAFHRASQTTALGKGMAKRGRLQRRGITDTAQFIRRFLAACRPLDQVWCVGTAAAREAENVGELHAALRERAGVNLTVVSGQEEARLSWLGALQGAIGLPIRNPVLADVGGRSTELVTRRSRGLRAVSLPLGARSLTEEFLRSEKPSRIEVSRARRVVREALEVSGSLIQPGVPVLTTGGTAISACVLLGYSQRVSGTALARLRRRLSRLTLEERRGALYFDPPRAEVICGGLILLEALAERAPGGAVYVSFGGVREGLLLSETGARALVFPPDLEPEF